jgi:hypothetical protein
MQPVEAPHRSSWPDRARPVKRGLRLRHNHDQTKKQEHPSALYRHGRAEASLVKQAHRVSVFRSNQPVVAAMELFRRPTTGLFSWDPRNVRPDKSCVLREVPTPALDAKRRAVHISMATLIGCREQESGTRLKRLYAVCPLTGCCVFDRASSPEAFTGRPGACSASQNLWNSLRRDRLEERAHRVTAECPFRRLGVARICHRLSTASFRFTSGSRRGAVRRPRANVARCRPRVKRAFSMDRCLAATSAPS